MSSKIGTTKISEIYCGATRMKKIYLGTTELYSRGMDKLVNLPTTTTAIAVDDDYIYVVGSATSTTAPTIYTIDKKTNVLTQLTHPFPANRYIYNVRSNGLLVLFMNTDGSYAWYDKSTNAFSELYSKVNDSVYSCDIDLKYTFFGVLNGLVRVNNSTKVVDTYSCTTPWQIISTGFLDIYLYSNEGVCQIVDINSGVIISTINKPSEVTSIQVGYSLSSMICQNSSYVFQVCKNTSDGYNQILVTNKNTNETFLTSAISGITGIPKIACNENRLYVTDDNYIYIYRLSKNLVDYTVEDIDEYTESDTSNRILITNTTADEEGLYMTTLRPQAVFKY